MNKKMLWSLTTMLCLILVSIIAQKRALSFELNIATVDVIPRGYINEQGEPAGGSYDVVNRIVTEAGYPYFNTIMPYPRIMKELQYGKIDLALLVPNEKLNKIAIPIAYVRDVQFIVIGRKGTEIKSLNDIDGKRVGFLRNAVIPSKLVEGRDVLIAHSNDYTQLIKRLQSQRIDYIIGPRINIYWALKELGAPPDSLGQGLTLKRLEMFLVYSRKTADAQVLMNLASAIKKLQKNGVIKEALNKYDYETY